MFTYYSLLSFCSYIFRAGRRAAVPHHPTEPRKSFQALFLYQECLHSAGLAVLHRETYPHNTLPILFSLTSTPYLPFANLKFCQRTVPFVIAIIITAVCGLQEVNVGLMSLTQFKSSLHVGLSSGGGPHRLLARCTSPSTTGMVSQIIEPLSEDIIENLFENSKITANASKILNWWSKLG